MGKPAIDVPALLAQLRITYPDIAELHPLNEGQESRAFAFDSAEAPYVVRVNPSVVGFEKDRMAFQKFCSSALPVPEVTLIETHGTDMWICASRRVAGSTLQDLPQGGAFAYGAAIGRVMDAMSEVSPADTKGAGPLDAAGIGAYETWQEFLADIGNWDWPDLGGVDLAFVGAIVADIMRVVPELPDLRRLVHGDFGSNNVLVADGTVAGVIDWSEAMLGDPQYDLANLLFWRPWLDCMEQQCRYFTLAEPWRLAERQRLRCFQLHIGLKVLRDALMDRDDSMAGWSLARCRAIANGR